MMDETRVDSYIESLGSPAPAYLEELAKNYGLYLTIIDLNNSIRFLESKSSV